MTEENGELTCHEAIPDMIRRSSSDELTFFAPFIKKVKIPEGHDEIIAAWRKRAKAMLGDTEAFGVPGALLAKKRVAEKGKKEYSTGLDGYEEILDDLQEEVERLCGQLKRERHPGLSSWISVLDQRMKRVRKLISIVCGHE